MHLLLCRLAQLGAVCLMLLAAADLTAAPKHKAVNAPKKLYMCPKCTFPGGQQYTNSTKSAYFATSPVVCRECKKTKMVRAAYWCASCKDMFSPRPDKCASSGERMVKR